MNSDAANPSRGDQSSSVNGRWIRRMLFAGWLGLAVFLVSGVALEVLHGLKLPVYLDVRHGTRRLLWTMAHAHGTLFSMVLILAGLVWRTSPIETGRGWGVIGWGLLGGQILVPLGFLLGGGWLVGGEPGPGILLVVPGAALFLLGVGGMTLEAWASFTAPASGSARRDRSANRG